MQPMANIALRAARKAADYISRSIDRPDEFEVESKGRNDFVSNIDRMAESIIIEQIRETYPDHSILAEESGSIQGNSEFTWIIDPLDGTLNFLQGIPHFSVSIGIMKGLHHEHGVIVDPVRGDEFVASRGSGAQLNGKRIRVSARAKIEDCVLATSIPPGSIENRLETHMDSVKRITRTCRAVRQGGSAALDLAYVAAGRLDGFWQMDLSKWDIAAGIVLVREAGGFIGDLNGGESFWETGDIAAANPKCFRNLIQKFKENG
jgi:myo-inositol-1(or 4)-monophosphatase